MTAAELHEAVAQLTTTPPPGAWSTQLASCLGVDCLPAQPGFKRALAAAIARFELRTLPFSNEVDGRLDQRTRRFLEMLFPPLRAEDHPCRRVESRPVYPLLTPAQLTEAKRKNGERSGRTESWVRVLQHVLGAGEPSGVLDAPTLQRIAAWQRTLRVVKPGIRVDGILHADTLEALQRAFPRLRQDAPELTGPERFLPGCVVQWQDADVQARAFMMRVYETQRVWAAQRREFVGWVPDAAPIEEGRTAREDAARGAQALLRAARASVAKPTNPAHGGDLQVLFGYRSAPVQVVIWEYHFAERYRRTAARRGALAGGAHGPEAVIDMAKYYAARTASPGYSVHNRGLAVDLACITPQGRTILPTGRFLTAWKGAWCFPWLEKHAATHGFHQNTRINEPWHWEYKNP